MEGRSGKKEKKCNDKIFVSVQGAWALLGEEIPKQLFCEGHRGQFVKVFNQERRYMFEAFELHN